MSDYILLKEIILLVESYKEEHSSDTVEDFTVWLNNQLFSGTGTEDHNVHNEISVAFKMMFLNKELKKQTKKVLSETDITSIDEYSFLIHLNYAESYRKMEIIEMHNLEAPTGIEIIKRLLKNKLIEEFADKDDKRAKRIRITQKGISIINQIEPKINLIFKKFVEPLNLDEKIQLNGFLNKLIG